MKKGKQNHSNIIAVTALSLLCVGILGGAFLLNRSPEPVFEPAASEPAAETVTWSEPETKPAAASLPKETDRSAYTKPRDLIYHPVFPWRIRPTARLPHR